MPRAEPAPASVTEAGAALADEIGIAQLSVGLLAEHLGVKTPSLYKHVDGLGDLVHGIAVSTAIELGDGLRDATQGRADSDALTAAAQAMHTYVRQHPGRYAAGNSVRPAGDPLTPAINRVVSAWAATLRGYQPDGQEIQPPQMLRSMRHGFATLEAEGQFRFDTDIDGNVTWMINFVDHRLRSAHGSTL